VIFNKKLEVATCYYVLSHSGGTVVSTSAYVFRTIFHGQKYRWKIPEETQNPVSHYLKNYFKLKKCCFKPENNTNICLTAWGTEISSVISSSKYQICLEVTFFLCRSVDTFIKFNCFSKLCWNQQCDYRANSNSRITNFSSV